MDTGPWGTGRVPETSTSDVFSSYFGELEAVGLPCLVLMKKLKLVIPGWLESSV